MNWVVTFGLALNTVGALFVLAPRLQTLMRGLDRVWWFQHIEEAKAQFYRQGKIDRETPGFNHIAAAVEYGSNWTNLPGERLEQGGKSEIQLEIDGEIQHFENEGYDLFEIERIEDEDAYPMFENLTGRPPVSQTIFILKYRPRVAEETGIPILKEMIPFIAVRSPPGQLPRQVQDHKERLVFRLGASLLLSGFLFQFVPSVLRSLTELGIL